MKKTESKIEVIERKLSTDSRGWFLKVINGNERNNPFPCEVYVTSAKPGESKGGHYHLKAQEWFTLIKGEAIITVYNISKQEKTEITLSETDPKTIFVPAGYAHNFQNIGKIDFILLAYTDVKYDPLDTITYNFIA